MALKVLLSDDRPFFRQQFQQMIVSLPDVRLSSYVEDCADLEFMVDMVKPDVLLLNLTMNGVNGADTIRRLCQIAPDIQIIAVSRQDDEVFILDLLRSGARGFLPLSADAAEAVKAVQQLSQGVRYINPAAADRLINLLIDKTTYLNTVPYEKLTRREREVFHLTVEGFSGPEIAARLTISPRTVELHRSNLMRKLGLNNQRDLIRYAVQSGVLPLDEKRSNPPS